MKTAAVASCGACGAQINVELSMPKIQNFETFSLIVVEHSGPVLCMGCNQTVVPSVVQLGQVGVIAVPMKAEPSKVIVPGNGRIS